MGIEGGMACGPTADGGVVRVLLRYPSYFALQRHRSLLISHVFCFIIFTHRPRSLLLISPSFCFHISIDIIHHRMFLDLINPHERNPLTGDCTCTFCTASFIPSDCISSNELMSFYLPLRLCSYSVYKSKDDIHLE